MNIIGRKNLYFAISGMVIIPGLVSLVLWGLNLSIDFKGGSRMTLLFPNQVQEQTVAEVKQIYQQDKAPVATVQQSDKQLIVRTTPLSQAQHQVVLQDLQKKFAGVKEDTFETVGPTIGSETTKNAVAGVGLASLLIVLYIAFAFREVPKPANSWRFGICAIVALLHDVLVVVGIFSILGHFFNVEVDSLFVTALLTVIGFSVHDTIVVFDRIRENLKRNLTRSFEEVVNESILQTLGRSLNTSLTVLLVLLALLLFGGESTKWFVVALLVGVISGTYSSIFNASPLLVLWHEWSQSRKKK
ncbi:MAG: protein translocase subunit SecF [Patescibacteria group bacterium]|nr:protein translocase subunit SecF [Patescibacteria group bacterium]